MRRRTTRRALLAGGGAVLLAGAVGAEIERRSNRPVPPPPIGDFFLGLNVSGLEDDVPAGPTGAMLDTYASYGVRRLRLPGRWEHFQPRPLRALDRSYLKLYLGVVAAAAERGMTVLVEPCHNYGGRTVHGTDHKLGDGTLTAAMLVDFWRRMVDAAADTPGIAGWDLMEEPGDLPGDTIQASSQVWVDAAQKVVTAIRGLGERRPITVEAYSPGNPLAWTEANTRLHTVTDPLDRLIFSDHVFLDHDDSGTRPYWNAEARLGDNWDQGRPMTYEVGVKRISPFVDWLRAHGLRGSIGEIGAGWRDSPNDASDAGWQIALEAALTYCRETGVPAYAWGAGPHLIPPYELSLEPRDGLPAPQWTVLERYLPLADRSTPVALPSASSSPSAATSPSASVSGDERTARAVRRNPRQHG